MRNSTKAMQVQLIKKNRKMIMWKKSVVWNKSNNNNLHINEIGKTDLILWIFLIESVIINIKYEDKTKFEQLHCFHLFSSKALLYNHNWNQKVLILFFCSFF